MKHLKIKQKWNSALSLELFNSFDLKMSWDGVSWV